MLCSGKELGLIWKASWLFRLHRHVGPVPAEHRLAQNWPTGKTRCWHSPRDCMRGAQHEQHH